MFGIVAQSPPRVDVVDLEIGCASAVLAVPAVALQHLLAELAVRVRVEAEPGPGAARDRTSHEAFLNCSKNCRRCAGGRNW